MSHNSDGSLQTHAVQQGGAITSVNGINPTSGTVILGEGDIPNLESDLSNRIQLGGDLGGSTSVPTLTNTTNVQSIISSNSTVIEAVNAASTAQTTADDALAAIPYVPQPSDNYLLGWTGPPELYFSNNAPTVTEVYLQRIVITAAGTINNLFFS